MIQADLNRPEDAALWKDESLDTVLCCGVLEHVGPDEAALRSFRDSLQPGGHCIVVVPAEAWLYDDMDRQQGHLRRYGAAELRQKMECAGFEIVSRAAWANWDRCCGGFRAACCTAARWGPGKSFGQTASSPSRARLDCCLPMAGRTLVMVGRRKETV